MALTQLKTAAIADDAVTTDKLANAINTERTANTAKVSLTDNSVTLAKMAGGTDGQIITYDASGNPVAVGPGTDGQVLTSTGAGSPPAFEAITSTLSIGTLTSVGTGTSKDFTVNTTNVYKIEMLFHGMSSSGNTDWQFQLGDSGGIETSGYVVSAGYYSNANYVGSAFRTDGFRWRGIGDASYLSQGIMTFSNYDGNRWMGDGTLGTQTSNDGSQYHMIGSKELSGALTTIRIMASSDSSQSFDGGHIKIITYSY